MTALYELVLAGAPIPSAEGAPALDDGEPYAGEELWVRPEELARVKIRYKEVDAPATAEAHQVDAGITAEDLAPSFDDADGDLRWAAAIAAFAEILKESPYGDPAHVPTIQAVVAAEKGGDPDRVEFAGLLATAVERLGDCPSSRDSPSAPTTSNFSSQHFARRRDRTGRRRGFRSRRGRERWAER